MGGYFLVYPAIVWGLSFTLALVVLVSEDRRVRSALVRVRHLVIGDG
jgi:hypothetical protein